MSSDRSITSLVAALKAAIRRAKPSAARKWLARLLRHGQQTGTTTQPSADRKPT
jgi:hypothetical protein